MRPPMEKSVQSAISEQAARWFVINRDPAVAAEHRSEFFAWLKESPACVREYLAIAALADDIQGMPADSLDLAEIERRIAAEASAGASNVVTLDAARTTRGPAFLSTGRQRFGWVAASVAAIVLAATLGLVGIRADWFGLNPETLQTAHGEQRIWRLDDGSVMHLNSDSSVVVRFSGDERLIVLERGQGLFEVAGDPARPFRVDAGIADVVAVGTRFDVYRRASDALVTVAEGQVAVVAVSGERVRRPAGSRTDLRLSAGQQARIADDRGTIQTGEVDIRHALAWTRKQIVLDGRTLAEVVQEFNRYSAVPIVVQDPSLARLRLGGVLDAYDSASFLEFLRHMGGVGIEQDRERVLLRKLDKSDPVSSSGRN